MITDQKYKPKPGAEFESNLVRLVQGILSDLPAEQLVGKLNQTCKSPPCLSRHCVTVLQDSLAKGTMLKLARWGWRNDRYLSVDNAGDLTIREGRIWEREEPEKLSLHFSSKAMQFLIWMTESDVSATAKKARFRNDSFTLGDRFLFLLTYMKFRELPSIGDSFRKLEFFKNEPIIQLYDGFSFRSRSALSSSSFAPWMISPGPCILEALQEILTNRWFEMESQCRMLQEPKLLAKTGSNLREILTAFSIAIESRKRRDLGRFLLRALRKVLQSKRESECWFPYLNVQELRFRDRQELYRNGLVLLSHANQLQNWNAWAYQTGYLDEDYQASQHWKGDWEQEQAEQVLLAAQAALRAFEFQSA